MFNLCFDLGWAEPLKGLLPPLGWGLAFRFLLNENIEYEM